MDQFCIWLWDIRPNFVTKKIRPILYLTKKYETKSLKVQQKNIEGEIKNWVPDIRPNLYFGKKKFQYEPKGAKLECCNGSKKVRK